MYIQILFRYENSTNMMFRTYCLCCKSFSSCLYLFLIMELSKEVNVELMKLHYFLAVLTLSSIFSTINNQNE